MLEKRPVLEKNNITFGLEMARNIHVNSVKTFRKRRYPNKQKMLAHICHPKLDCYDHDIDIVGNDIGNWWEEGSVTNVKHAVECQRLCQAKDDCKFFVYGMSDTSYEPVRQRCFFKTMRAQVKSAAKIVSGPKFC